MSPGCPKVDEANHALHAREPGIDPGAAQKWIESEGLAVSSGSNFRENIARMTAVESTGSSLVSIMRARRPRESSGKETGGWKRGAIVLPDRSVTTGGEIWFQEN